MINNLGILSLDWHMWPEIIWSDMPVDKCWFLLRSFITIKMKNLCSYLLFPFECVCVNNSESPETMGIILYADDNMHSSHVIGDQRWFGLVALSRSKFRHWLGLINLVTSFYKFECSEHPTISELFIASISILMNDYVVYRSTQVKPVPMCCQRFRNCQEWAVVCLWWDQLPLSLKCMRIQTVLRKLIQSTKSLPWEHQILPLDPSRGCPFA